MTKRKKWENRKNFVQHHEKYTPVAIQYETEEQIENRLKDLREGSAEKQISDFSVKKTSLQPIALRDLMLLISNQDNLKNSLRGFNFDLSRTPLGKINKKQIEQGYETLSEIESIFRESTQHENRSILIHASNRYFTLIPHNFGWQKPPIIDNISLLRQEMDLLTALDDLEIATSFLDEQQSKSDPLLMFYKSLNATIEPLPKTHDMYQVISNYFYNSNENYTQFPECVPKIMEIFTVTRAHERERFEHAQNEIEPKLNKLLFHGSRIASFTGILSRGLRIMPYSGGRFGKGIYFADMSSKSLHYTDYGYNTDCLVLVCEVQLGNPYNTNYDLPYLLDPPEGYDCTKAVGKICPDTKQEITLTDGNIIIPQGLPINSGQYGSCHESEYIVYKEDQVNIKYLLRIKK